MMIISNRFRIILPAIVAAMAMIAIADETVRVSVKADRPEALYKLGETATFTLSAEQGGKPLATGTLRSRLLKDCGKPFEERSFDLARGTSFTMSGTLPVPGFLTCQAELVNDKDKKTKPIRGLAAVGFEPEKILPASAEPEDFNAFWANARAEAAKTPLDPKVTPIDNPSPKLKSWMINLADSTGGRIYGFLTLPASGTPPYPAAINVPCAGANTSLPGWPNNWAAEGVIVLTVNVHDYEPSQNVADNAAKFKKLNEQGGKAYSLQGIPDRDKYYFKRVILGLDRMVDYLLTHPDFDKKHVLFHGSSQGGGMALIMAGLRNDVAGAVAANVPAMCDQGGSLQNREPGWPKIVNDNAGTCEERLKMAGYYDAANFAKRIKCPALFGVGFLDEICCPSSVYAAYNSVSAPKTLIAEPLMHHCGSATRFITHLNTWPKQNAAPNVSLWGAKISN